MSRLLLVGLFLTLVVLSPIASAHKPSDSYLSLNVTDQSVSGQWDIALRDLEFAIGLDGNDDGNITWGELRGRHDAIAAYALSRLRIRAGAGRCVTRALEQLVDYHSDGAYSVLRFAAECEKSTSGLEIAYSLLFDLDPQHRGLMRAQFGDDVQTAIFSAEQQVKSFNKSGADSWRQFFDYVREGVWHIWIGFDHVLFLLTLLLPAVLRRRSGRWQAVESMREAFLEVVKVVTAFTLAHSITLSLSVVGVISLPARLVESAIAASVVIVALNNLFPIVTRRTWIIAFGFGLVHGFGFATVLKDLGLPDGALIRSLFGFNLGVELGQLAIVACLMPVIYRLRDVRFYRRAVLGAGSAAVAGIAAIWLVERAFDISPLLS